MSALKVKASYETDVRRILQSIQRQHPNIVSNDGLEGLQIDLLRYKGSQRVAKNSALRALLNTANGRMAFLERRINNRLLHWCEKGVDPKLVAELLRLMKK